MSDAAEAVSALRVRELRSGDLRDLIRIDEQHTDEAKPRYWNRVLRDFLEPDHDRPRVGLAAELDSPESGSGMIGYLLGEVRAFEFGSEACGWVFGVGVARHHLRDRVASALLAECCRRFRESGVRRVRTMVRRDNVPVLSFFRANGFVAGTFAQLELDLEEEEG